jgi:hypothetical protein
MPLYQLHAYVGCNEMWLDDDWKRVGGDMLKEHLTGGTEKSRENILFCSCR